MKVLAAAVVGISWLAAHPASKAEWWYYTGHLHAASGQEFGFELTLFRGSPRTARISTPRTSR